MGTEAASKFRFNSARPREAPAAHGFEDREQTRRYQHQTNPKLKVSHDDSRDQAKCAENAAGQPAVKADVWTKETAHKLSIAQVEPRGKRDDA